MRYVTRLAPFDFYRFVLEHIGPLFVGMAFKADKILRGRSTHLFRLHRAVDVVTVVTLNQTFIHPMVERHVELRFLSKMARVAKLGLRFGKQEIRIAAVMRRMA